MEKGSITSRYHDRHMEEKSKKPRAFDAINVIEFRLYIIMRFFFIMALRMIGTVVGWKIYILTRNPLALAAALEKIEHAEAPTLAIKRGSAHLCIADPLGRKSSLREGKLADIFGTHPPMAIRVARLKAMGYQEQKRLA